MRFNPLRHFCETLATLALFAIILVISPVVGAQSAAPFLYYYLKGENAFVVERADGRDRRILTAFEMPASDAGQEWQYLVVGPGWSPSGKWFAWRETTSYGGVSSGHVVNKEGMAISIPVLNNENVAEMRWSPAEDFLMVMTRTNFEQPFLYDVYIVDMQSTSTPIHARNTEKADENSYDFAGWTPDGRYIVQYYTGSNHTSRMSFTSPNGDEHIREFYRLETTCSYPAWSQDGKVVYVDSSNQWLAIENTVENSMQYAELPDGNIRRMAWSGDSKHVLIYTSDDCSRLVKQFSLWIVSVEDNALRFICDDVQLPFNPSLPYSLLNLNTWSRNNNYITFTNQGDLLLYDMVNRGTVRFAASLNGIITDTLWTLDNELLVALTLQGSRTSSSIRLYDPTTQNTTLIVDDNPQAIANLALSADARYLAYSTSELHIFNMITKENIDISNLLTPYDVYQSNVRQVVWHPSENWIIALAGDSVGGVYVSNADGSVQRKLTTCSKTETCFGWLLQ